MKQVLLYLPVVHAGHEAFFARHRDAAEVLILGSGFKRVFKSLAKDIRALPPERGGMAPAVALTAFARSEDRRARYLPGYQIHVAKPVDPSELITVCASVVRSPAQ